jgi:hypothetical protein
VFRLGRHRQTVRAPDPAVRLLILRGSNKQPFAQGLQACCGSRSLRQYFGRAHSGLGQPYHHSEERYAKSGANGRR